MDWLTGTTFGKFIWAFCISMIPIVELRGGLPVAITSGLPLWLAYIATVLGNMLPVPFIIIFIKKVFAWLRLHWPWMNAVVTRLEKRAESKSDVIERYGPWGLLRNSRTGYRGMDRSVDCRAAEHEDEAGNPDYFCRSMYCGDHRYRDHIRCDSTRVRGVI